MALLREAVLSVAFTDAFGKLWRPGELCRSVKAAAKPSPGGGALTAAMQQQEHRRCDTTQPRDAQQRADTHASSSGGLFRMKRVQRSSSNSLFGSAMSSPVLMHATYSAYIYQQVLLMINGGPRGRDRRFAKVIQKLVSLLFGAVCSNGRLSKMLATWHVALHQTGQQCTRICFFSFLIFVFIVRDDEGSTLLGRLLQIASSSPAACSHFYFANSFISSSDSISTLHEIRRWSSAPRLWLSRLNISRHLFCCGTSLQPLHMLTHAVPAAEADAALFCACVHDTPVPQSCCQP